MADKRHGVSDRDFDSWLFGLLVHYLGSAAEARRRVRAIRTAWAKAAIAGGRRG